MTKIKQELRVKIWNKFKKRCAYCGCVLTYNKMQVDHISPLYRGTSQYELSKYNILKGENKEYNYNPSCPSCNSSKSTFTIEKWRAEINKKTERLKRDSSTYRLLLRFGLVKEVNVSCRFYFEKFLKK